MSRRNKAIHTAKNIYRLMNDESASMGERETAEHKLNEMFKKYGFGYKDLWEEPKPKYERTYRTVHQKKQKVYRDHIDITNKKPNWKQAFVNRIFGLDKEDNVEHDEPYIGYAAPNMKKEDIESRVFHGRGSGTPNNENVRSRRYFSTNDDL